MIALLFSIDTEITKNGGNAQLYLSSTGILYPSSRRTRSLRQCVDIFSLTLLGIA